MQLTAYTAVGLKLTRPPATAVSATTALVIVPRNPRRETPLGHGTVGDDWIRSMGSPLVRFAEASRRSM